MESTWATRVAIIMIIDIYWEKLELVSVKKAAIELKVPHIIGSLSRKLLQELARFTLGNLATKPSTTTVDHGLRPSSRLRQVRTTEQRKFRLARSRLKG